MASPALGKLEKVNLREVWLSEASSFTPWLAQEENLNLLGDAIGMELELESQEKQVGPFRADILCKDVSTDSWVLIENQIEKTDHSHLGQLITYAAGLNAVTIIWIAERFISDHRAALDWLNERTDDKINFFGLEIELWKIGNSQIAPKFNIISQPNDWVRTVQKAANNVEISEHKLLQQRFWTGFAKFMNQEGTFIKCTKPLPQHWMNISIGKSGFKLAAITSSSNTNASSKSPEIRAELVIREDNSKSVFAKLESRKKEIESKLGFSLIWYNPPNKAMSKIFARVDANFLNEKEWLEQFKWLKQNLEIMHKVFSPLIKALDDVE